MSLDRRTFLQSSVAALLAGSMTGPGVWGAETPGPRKKIAVVTTEWRYRSHAWHMAERFLHGYPRQGAWYRPPIDVVSAYVDQFPAEDLSRQRSEEFKFPIYKTVGEALRSGGRELAVDGVLIIGEHGKYDLSEFEQTKYPRYEFFKQVVEVFQQSGRVVPVFNDKHLSWNWEWAREMYDLAQKMKIPLAAGSSLPVTWRMPAVELPLGSEVDEILCVAFGGIDSYDFHALEVIQCQAERRKGGETGVKSVQALRGDAVWKLFESSDWSAGGMSPRLFEACLSRSQTLAQPATFSHRYPTLGQMREWVKKPVAYRIEYLDGAKATMLLMNGLVTDFTIAIQSRGVEKPFSTLFYLPPNPNVTYSAGLMAQAEETFVTGKSPQPLERTLLTTGLVEAGVRSLGQSQAKLATPHLQIRYEAPKDSKFLRD
jgi:hypothetical protein